MTNISDEMLIEALSPIPSDFYNLDIKKTSEKVIEGKYHVGFEVYVIPYQVDLLDIEHTSVIYDRGICIFSPGNSYRDDYISEYEKIIPVDSSELPKVILDEWVDYVTDRIDVPSAVEYLVEKDKNPSKVITEICEKVIKESGEDLDSWLTD